MAVFAAYKAFQKLEEVARGSVLPQGSTARLLSTDPVSVPSWVRAALWDTLEMLLTPGKASTGRRTTFLTSLKRTWCRYSLWFGITSTRVARATKSVPKVVREQDAGDGVARKTAYEWLEALKNGANARHYEDENGKRLANVEPRDLIPTGQLLQIFQGL